MTQLNWSLFLVTEDYPEDNLVEGEHGVFKSTFKPGIKEAPHGVLMVAPMGYVEEYLRAHYFGLSPHPDHVREAIIDYFRRYP